MDKSIEKMHGNVAGYVAIARLDHSTKHIFIVPGMILAYLLRGVHTNALVSSITLGLIAAICIASANYVINEWFDREFDKFHPTKSERTAVKTQLSGTVIFLEWTGLVAVGLGCAYAASKLTLLVACIFALQGIVYNVPPIRTKDKAYLDVISEAINNPLRLMIGWAMIDPTTLPPSSIILTYWAGGAFLMAAKRLSEFREITASHGREIQGEFRGLFGNIANRIMLRLRARNQLLPRNLFDQVSRRISAYGACIDRTVRTLPRPVHGAGIDSSEAREAVQGTHVDCAGRFAGGHLPVCDLREHTRARSLCRPAVHQPGMKSHVYTRGLA
jgi:hypothetical protein